MTRCGDDGVDERTVPHEDYMNGDLWPGPGQKFLGFRIFSALAFRQSPHNA